MKTTNPRVTEILEAHGLDFTINKRALTAFDDNGNILPSPYFGLFNSKTQQCLNTTKEGYTVSQNDAIVEMVLKGMESFGSDLTVSKAGALNGGGKVYLQLEINGVGHVANDIIKRYVTIIDSNDGSTSLSIGIGDLTMSCSNQFAKFYAKGAAKFRHTATIEQKMRTIPELIETALKESLKQIQVYNKFVSTEISYKLAHDLVRNLIGFDRLSSVADLATKSTQNINKMDKIYSHIDSEIKDKGMNVWGLHSGITSFTTHEISTPKRDNARIESTLIGGAYKMNQASLKFAERASGILELV